MQTIRGGYADQSTTDADVLASLERSLKPDTRLVVLSHLLWNTGQLMPIAAVAAALKEHPSHPYLLVDAAQTMGQIPVAEAASAADIYAFTGHKWACGPEGLGGVALSERVLAEASPTLIGWRSLQDETKAVVDDPDPFHHDSRRFEVATSCVPLLAGLRHSLQLLEAEGTPQERWARIQECSGRLWEQLESLPSITPLLTGPPIGGLVSFSLERNGQAIPPMEIVKGLGAQQIWIRDLADPVCLRACTHVCTTGDDIEALLQALNTIPR